MYYVLVYSLIDRQGMMFVLTGLSLFTFGTLGRLGLLGQDGRFCFWVVVACDFLVVLLG
jgi:hypothetical protein